MLKSNSLFYYYHILLASFDGNGHHYKGLQKKKNETFKKPGFGPNSFLFLGLKTVHLCSEIIINFNLRRSIFVFFFLRRNSLRISDYYGSARLILSQAGADAFCCLLKCRSSRLMTRLKPKKFVFIIN